MPPTFPIEVTTPLGNYHAQSSGVSGGIGPYNIDANVRYLFYTGFNSVQQDNTLAIIKSTDAGLTWTAMDEAGAPLFTDNNDNSTSCYDGSRYIYSLFMEPTNINHGIVKACRFDTQTDTWGTVVIGVTSGAGTNLDIMCCWVSALGQVATIWDDDGNNSKYQLYDPNSSTFSAASVIPRVPSTGGNVVNQMIEGAGGVVHYLTTENAPPLNSILVFCSIDSGSTTFATPQIIGNVVNTGVGLNGAMVFDSTTGLITMAWQSPNDPDPAVQATINVIQGTSQLNVTFSDLTTITSPGAVTISGYNVVSLGITQGSQLGLFWFDDDSNFYFSLNFAAPTLLGTDVDVRNIQVNGFVPSTSLTGYALAWSATGYWELEIAPPPPVATPISTPYGSKGPVAPPNDYTMCLVREYHLFKELEFSKLECCPGHECIITDYVEPVGIGYEETSDGLAFNPVNAIPLPDPTDGEVVVLSEVVPIGYDGMILAQFHGYIQSPSGTNVSSFTEGSGDIAWRITSNDRYLKDCGNMLVSIGSTQRLAPIYGGIRVRSGDTITYRVQVYNLSGLLTPGIGSIIAGLHGFFYPRK